MRLNLRFPHVRERAETRRLKVSLPVKPRIPQLSDSLFPAFFVYPLAGENIAGLFAFPCFRGGFGKESTFLRAGAVWSSEEDTPPDALSCGVLVDAHD